MHLHPLLDAFILGVVEGLTEFLPVSSTGHLILVGDLLGFQNDLGKLFEIVIQLGAILAVVVFSLPRLWRVVAGLGSDPGARRFAWAVIIAFLPAAVLGALLHAIGCEPRERARESSAVFPAHGEDRAELDHDVEDLALLVVQPEKVGDDDEVTGRGDRKELGEPLHHSKDEGIDERVEIHRGVV